MAAAKQEGKVSVLISPGDVYRQVAAAFQQKYSIEVETLPGNGTSDLVPKIATERKAGQSNWDLLLHSPSNGFKGLKPVGLLRDLRPTFILPDVVDDGKWSGGFGAGWSDTDRSLVYTFIRASYWTAWVNRQALPEGQLSRIDQLWDPQWKGKIAWFDPRMGSGSGAAALLGLVKGEDKLRALLRDQQPALSQDRRQLAQWVVRSQYPIGLGVTMSTLNELAQSGVDIKHVQPLDPADPAAASVTAATGAVMLLTEAPHPNAATVFINWVLSREGQLTFSERTALNSRRLDVPVVDPDTAPDPKRDYLDTGTEANSRSIDRAQQIAREVLG